MITKLDWYLLAKLDPGKVQREIQFLEQNTLHLLCQVHLSQVNVHKKYVNKIRRSSKAVGNDTLAEMLEGLEKLMKKERIQSQAKKSAERRERRASRLPLLREKT